MRKIQRSAALEGKLRLNRNLRSTLGEISETGAIHLNVAELGAVFVSLKFVGGDGSGNQRLIEERSIFLSANILDGFRGH